MKKKIIVLCFILMPIFIFGQKLFKNPALKDNDKIGKIIKLEKILSITDDSGDFNFNWFGHCKTAKDGSIFIKDKYALFRFDKQGKYLGNLFKKGEGPGELDWLYRYFINKNSIIMYSHTTSKIVIVDYNGKLKKEFRIPGGGMKLLMAVSKRKYYYRVISTKKMDQKLKGREGKYILNYKYSYWDEKKSSKNNNSLIFPEIKTYTTRNNKKLFLKVVNKLTFSEPVNGTQFFSNSQDYNIIMLDVNNFDIKKKFTREYKRVRFFPPKLDAGTKMTPILKILVKMTQYKNDVMSLIHRKNKLWAITSTYVKNKGILIDVFDLNGLYINKLYLPLAEETSKWSPSFSIDGNRLIKYIENDDDSTVIIYKMEF